MLSLWSLCDWYTHRQSNCSSSHGLIVCWILASIRLFKGCRPFFPIWLVKGNYSVTVLLAFNCTETMCKYLKLPSLMLWPLGGSRKSRRQIINILLACEVNVQTSNSHFMKAYGGLLWKTSKHFIYFLESSTSLSEPATFICLYQESASKFGLRTIFFPSNGIAGQKVTSSSGETWLFSLLNYLLLI